MPACARHRPLARGARVGAAVVVLAAIVGAPGACGAVATAAAAGSSAACATAQARVPPPGVSSPDPVLELATGLEQPDDLVRWSGRLLVGEYGSGRIAQVDGPGGPLVPLLVRVPEVEGLAGLGGTLVVADQATDQVVTVAAARVRSLVSLRPVPGVEGVDGVGAAAGQVIIPDSARGSILWVTPRGRTVHRMVGFDRPTGVWPLPGGGVLVAVEDGGEVMRVAADGARSLLASGLDLPDDVARSASGTTYVVAIGSGVLDRVGGRIARVLVSGLGQPQGLALDGAGNPIVTESSQGRVDLVVTTLAVEPPGPIPALPAGGRLCVRLVRGPGFSAAAMIAASSFYRVGVQPGRGTRGVVRVGACARICRLDVVVRSGRLTASTWLAYRHAPTPSV